MSTDSTGDFVESGVSMFVEAAAEMGLPHGEEIISCVEGWFRFYSSWAGRRVVGFTEVSDIAVKLIADSFAIVHAAPLRDGKSRVNVIDLGSGNGWPGLALKCLLVDSGLTLLDSRLGACEFLEGYISSSALKDINVIPLRAEDAAKQPQFKAKFDLVVTRAMAQPGVALELAFPFSGAKGRVALWLGPECAEKVKERREIPELGVHLAEAHEYGLAGERGRRLLAVYHRDRGPMKGYPRSFSSIKARPLL